MSSPVRACDGRSAGTGSHCINAGTLVDILRARADAHPDRVLYTYLKRARDVERELSFAALDRRARAIAARIQTRVPAGSCVAVICANDLGFIEAFMGCQYAAVIPVPSPPLQGSHAIERMRVVFEAANPACIVTTSAIGQRLSAQADRLPLLGRLDLIPIDSIPDADAEGWRAPELDAEHAAFLQFTSGSLSSPKGVTISHANIVHNLGLLQHAFAHTEHSRIVGWLPFFHDWGLIGGLLQPIYSGIQSILFDPLEFIRKPVSWLNTISRFGATVSGAPSFAYDHCLRAVRPEDLAALDLSRWDIAIVGAEPINADTLARFAETFARCGFERRSFLTCYGLAESTLVVTASSRRNVPETIAIDRDALQGSRIVAPCADDERSARVLTSCGQGLLDQEIRIVDVDTGQPLEAMRIGEIRVRGPSVAKGYWNDDAASAETFSVSTPGNDDDGAWLRTGDEGFIRDGELFVTGRIKELIIVTGRNFYPEDVENVAVGAHPALGQGRGAAFSVEIDGSEQLVLVQEVEFHRDLDGEAIVDEIRRAVVAAIGVVPAMIELVRTGVVPLTTSGKVQRQACRQAHLDATIPRLYQWHSRSA